MGIINILNIQKLLSESEYRIPIYQRNYAWSIPEVTQLIQDIADYANESAEDNYYIGTLVVFPHSNEGYFETIDGQQRSTTITIIACSILHNSYYDMSWYKGVNVSFDHRERSNETLHSIFAAKDPRIESDKINTEIITVYNNVWHIIEQVCKNKGLNINSFIEYLLHKVILLRVAVPTDTDLNHYFEIMNSRGEQLEQHEIVKALLMSPLKDSLDDMRTFSFIWDACSNMGRYVQMNISKPIRGYFFKENEIDNVEEDFDELSFAISQNPLKQNQGEKCLIDLFKDDLNKVSYEKPWEEQGKNNEQPESFGTIISFSNFLLHVLKVMNPQNKDVVLDDKKLIAIFKSCYELEQDKQLFVKRFIMQLLKVRYLFDKFVIKRKLEKWSLKQLKKSSKDKLYYGSTFSKQDNVMDNYEKDVIMLQAMFHVSLPSQIYKHWLNAVLLYVYNNPDTTSHAFSEYLWSLAKSYLLDRYLATEESIYSFEDIIFKNNGVPQNNEDAIDWTNINVDNSEDTTMAGEKVENFVFNFYDYILWKEQKTADFEFSYRTSVEHFYPQHPIDNKMMDKTHLHSFGNLCLVSNSMNSKFSNSLPAAKYSNFGTDNEQNKTYSIKLQNMMQSMRDHDKWDENKIEQEAQSAKNLMIKYLFQS